MTGNPLDTAQGTRARLFALLRGIIFFALAFAMGAVLLFAATKLLGTLDFDKAPGPSFLIPINLALVVATVLIPTAIMALITRERPARFGFPRAGAVGQLTLGVFTGLLAMSALMGLMALLGGVRSWTFEPLGAATAMNGAGYVCVFALTAISEEGGLRAYGLAQLSRAISFWPAAIVTSILFIVLHLGHKTESIVGLAQVGIIGMILAWSFRRSGALWFALGCHGAWDFAETYVYGVPDSGMTAPGALSHIVLQGPDWMTGGVTGPEASWLAFLALAGIALTVHLALRPALAA